MQSNSPKNTGAEALLRLLKRRWLRLVGCFPISTYTGLLPGDKVAGTRYLASHELRPPWTSLGR